MENHGVMEEFKGNSNIIYERLEPVYAVLNHIYDMVCDETELDEDLETIFEVGFQYLSSQFEVIKIYYESLFQSNCDDFIEYSEMLLYLLYIFDIRTDMENNGLNSDIEELNDLETNIENMIMERRDDTIYLKSEINRVLQNVFETLGYEYVSIIDIFAEISETLGIYLYEEDEIVIGKDI